MEEEKEKDKSKVEEQTPIEKFNDDLRDYLATRYELTLLKTTQKVSIVASMATFGAILAIVIVLFIMMITLAAGFYLSAMLGSYGHGFLLLSGIFLLIAIIFFAMRKKWVLKPVRDKVIKAMFDED